MSAQLRLDGMTELREALRKLPEELAGEAANIIEGIANGVASETRRVYPIQTGRLVGGVKVTHFEHGKVAAGAVVKARLPIRTCTSTAPSLGRPPRDGIAGRCRRRMNPSG